MKDRSISQLKSSIKQKMSVNTQTELAKALKKSGIKISQSYISKILNGKRKPKNVGSILEALNSALGNNTFSKN